MRPDNTPEAIEQARVFVREKPSTSYLQRKMQIGYNRAADLMEFFENEGMVSARKADGSRKLLIPEAVDTVGATEIQSQDGSSGNPQ